MSQPTIDRRAIRLPRMTHSGAWFRGLLVVSAAVVSYLSTNPTFIDLYGKTIVMWLGGISVALLTVRQFMDQSLTQAEQGSGPPAPVPVDVTNPPEQPIPTTEEPKP